MKRLLRNAALVAALATAAPAAAQIGPGEELTLELIIAARRIAEVGIQITMPGEAIREAVCSLPGHDGTVERMRYQIELDVPITDLPDVEYTMRVLFPALSDSQRFRVASVMEDGTVGEFCEWSEVYDNGALQDPDQ